MSDLAALWAPTPEPTDKSKSERPADNAFTAVESIRQQVLDSWRSREDSYAFVPEKIATARKAEQKGDWDGALKAYQADLDEQNKGLSTWSDSFRNSPNTYDKPILADQIAMARCYEKLGKYDEAAKCQESSLKIYQKQYGYNKNYRCEYDQATVDCLSGMAKNLEKTGKYAEAIPHYNALAEVHKKYGYSEYISSDADRGLIKYHDDVSRCFALTGKYDEAIEHQRKLGKIYEKQSGFSPYMETKYDAALLTNQKKIAALCAAKGDIPKALEAQEQIRQMYERKLGATDSYPGKHATKLAEYHSDVADLYKKQGKTQNSIEQRQAALRLYEREQSYSYPPDKTLNAKTLKLNSDLAVDLLAAGRKEESLKHMERCWHLMESAEKPDRTAIRALKENMAQQYTALGQHDKELPIRKSIYADYKECEVTGKPLDDAYAAMVKCYEKLGKNTETELRKEDVEDFARRDNPEKAAYLLNKLPKKLEVSATNGELKIASDDFLKLANILPGTDLAGMLREQLKDVIPVEADRQKSVSDVTAFLSGLKSMSFNTKDKHFEMVTDKERAISMKFHPAFDGIIVSPQFSFDFRSSQGETTKIELANIKGLKASSLGGMLKTEVQSIAVMDEKQADGTLNRVVELSMVNPMSKDGKPTPTRFTIMQNVPKESADALKNVAGKIDGIAAKIGAGDINGVLELLGAGKLDGALEKAAWEFNSFRKDGSTYAVQFKNPQSIDVAQFGSPFPGTINLGQTVKFYRGKDSSTLDLSFIEGVNVNLSGDVTKINDGKPLSTNLQDLYLGSLINNQRMVMVKTDNVIKSVYLDVDSNFKPVPNSSGSVRMNNPLVGSKMESIPFKFDGNGNPTVSKGDIAYLVVEGGRSKIYDAMDWVIGK